MPEEANNHNDNSKTNKEVIPWGQAYVGIDKEIRNSKVKVAILDSGINSNHSDLKNKVTKSYNVIRSTNSTSDDFGHGTNIAGIITANHNSHGIIGVSPNVEIYDIKVLNAEGKGEIDDVLTALLWAYKNDVDIINISFGFSTNYSELQEMIDLLVSEGIIIVAASGNNLGQEVDYPARYPNVISVGSIDKDGNIDTLSAQGKIDVLLQGKIYLQQVCLGDTKK
ncbi:S8 family serine peptidase [Bacillus sp. PK3_68]|uniref:S8 family peptidase n=1 Tax=Bacillus sp. PK3_68 TaxID=2027408 RepID=UPI0016026391|nr:S8 family serine peptidase [Bacillus sp. PK3_68]